MSNDGIAYDDSDAWILRDGRVVDGTAFFDNIAFDELRTRAPAAG